MTARPEAEAKQELTRLLTAAIDFVRNQLNPKCRVTLVVRHIDDPTCSSLLTDDGDLHKVAELLERDADEVLAEQFVNDTNRRQGPGRVN